MANNIRQINPSRKKTKLRPQNYDYIILFTVVILVFFGIIMVFSASYYTTLTSSKFNNDMYYFLKRQLLWAFLGFIAMFVTMRLPLIIFKRFSFIAYLISNILLLILPILGTASKGQIRWIQIGPISFQPSEIAKISIILFLSLYISSHKNCLKDMKGFFRCCIIFVIPIILITLTNLSTAILILLFSVTILFVASPKIWYFIVMGIVAVLGGVVAISLPKFAYRFSRIKAWLDPFSDPLGLGFQIIQGLYAVASGGFFGLGLGQSRQKTFIPESHNDIIFAIICEELGMMGAFIIILLFAILIWRGLKVAIDSQDIFNCLVSTGITAMIGFQALINIAVVTNTIPNTGQPLPFISFGGTSLVTIMASVGILLNISKYTKNND